MGKSINSTNLNKNYILSKVSQVTIFSIYFDIPIEVIENCIETGKLICSTIREDSHETCGFRYNNKGVLKFKDFAGYFWGDCFDAVALIMSELYSKPINISDKKDFISVLRHITFTFKDIFYGKEKDINLTENIKTSLSKIKQHKSNIEIVIRDWEDNDKKYWNNFGVDLHYLNINFVYPVEQYYIDRKINPNPKYFYNTKDPCYAYFLGRDKYNNVNMKLYFPKRSKNEIRFITNCNHLEGILNLNRNDYDYIVITKSTKDRVSIGCTWHSFYGGTNKIKLGVINIPHETYKLREVEFRWLKDKLVENGVLLSLMDNDITGIEEAKYLKEHFNIPSLLIPREFAKDFAELRSKTSIKDIKYLIDKAISYVEKNYKYIGEEKKSDINPF